MNIFSLKNVFCFQEEMYVEPGLAVNITLFLSVFSVFIWFLYNFFRNLSKKVTFPRILVSNNYLFHVFRIFFLAFTQVILYVQPTPPAPWLHAHRRYITLSSFDFEYFSPVSSRFQRWLQLVESFTDKHYNVISISKFFLLYYANLIIFALFEFFRFHRSSDIEFFVV